MEPLARKAQVDGVGVGHMHAAERQIGRLPHLHAIGVGRKDWTTDVVSADQEHLIRLPIDHGHRHAVEPNDLDVSRGCFA